jgi:hypothetical protein
MPFDDEIAEEMAREIQKEIDEDIMASLLKNIGWIAIDFAFKDKRQVIQVNSWLLENCQGHFRRLNMMFLFEKTQDAQWFVLRWS